MDPRDSPRLAARTSGSHVQARREQIRTSRRLALTPPGTALELDADLPVDRERRLRLIETGEEEDIRVRAHVPEAEADEARDARLEIEVALVGAARAAVEDSDRKSVV